MADSRLPLSSTSLSKLEQMPNEILFDIFRHLLDARSIKLSRHPLQIDESRVANAEGHVRRPFCLSVLRLSKRLHEPARDIFKANFFIKVTMNLSNMGDTLARFNVPFISGDLLPSFTDHRVSIGVRCNYPYAVQTTSTVAIVLPDLERFCRCLRYMDIASVLLYEFRFEARSVLTPEEQCTLLTPFQQIEGIGAIPRLFFNQHFDKDTDVMRATKQAMTQPVGWARMLAWQVFDIACLMKSKADGAFVRGKHTTAFLRYDKALQWFDEAINVNAALHVCDEEVAMARFHLRCTLVACCLLALLKMMVSLARGNQINLNRHVATVLKQLEVAPPITHIRAEVSFLQGVRRLCTEKASMAAECFTQATEIDATNKTAYQYAHGIAKAWSGLRTAEQKKHMVAIFKDLRSEPYPTPEKMPYVCPQAKSEKWMCKELGFTGEYPMETTATIMEGEVVGYEVDPSTGQAATMQIGHVCPTALEPRLDQYMEERAYDSFMMRAHRKKLEGKSWVHLHVMEIGRVKAGDDSSLASLFHDLFRSTVEAGPGPGPVATVESLKASIAQDLPALARATDAPMSEVQTFYESFDFEQLLVTLQGVVDSAPN